MRSTSEMKNIINTLTILTIAFCFSSCINDAKFEADVSKADILEKDMGADTSKDTKDTTADVTPDVIKEDVPQTTCEPACENGDVPSG